MRQIVTERPKDLNKLYGLCSMAGQFCCNNWATGTGAYPQMCSHHAKRLEADGNETLKTRWRQIAGADRVPEVSVS